MFPEPQWWDNDREEILIRSQRTGSEPRLLRAPPEKLQTALDRAWRTFGDPTCELLVFGSNSPPRPSPQTQDTGTGRSGPGQQRLTGQRAPGHSKPRSRKGGR